MNSELARPRRPIWNKKSSSSPTPPNPIPLFPLMDEDDEEINAVDADRFILVLDTAGLIGLGLDNESPRIVDDGALLINESSWLVLLLLLCLLDFVLGLDLNRLLVNMVLEKWGLFLLAIWDGVTERGVE